MLHSLTPQGSIVAGAPLPVEGRTQHVPLTWGGVTCNLSFLVLRGLKGITGIVGMDVLQALWVWTDTQATYG